MNRLDAWRFRWNLARAVQRRDLHSTLYSLGLYVTLAAAIAVSATVLRNQVIAVQDSGLSVLSNPFAGSFFGAVVLSTWASPPRPPSLASEIRARWRCSFTPPWTPPPICWANIWPSWAPMY